MLERLYVNNFRCLQDFEFRPDGASSALLVGRNGAGKSTIMRVLQILQSIGGAPKRVSELVGPDDFSLLRVGAPMHIEIEAEVRSRRYAYRLMLGYGPLQGAHVLREQLAIDDQEFIARTDAQVTVGGSGIQPTPPFGIDIQLVALPVLPAQPGDSLDVFRQWLGRMILLAPVPQLMNGDAAGHTLSPRLDGSNLASWLASLLQEQPKAFNDIHEHLRQVMPDLVQFRSQITGPASKRLVVDFQNDIGAQLSFGFESLSDGEKCYFLCAVVIAANNAYGPVLAFWDEPDNHLSLAEVQHFVTELRRAFASRGQILMTSHDASAIRSFSDETTWLLDRRSHLEPTLVRRLSDVPYEGDLVQALTFGDLDA